MAADAHRLLALAEAVADGQAIDWAAEEARLPPDSQELVQELRLLAGVADVHRSASHASTSMGALALPDLSGTTWGPLHVREFVGGGSFGAVYRAWDPRLARDVALKLLRSQPAVESAAAIIEEGRLLARVRHPHVIIVYGADRFDGRVGIWMEFIEGRTLEQVLRQEGPFGAREAALIGIDLCSALAAVHARGLVHRDVKAQNVMREAGGRIVLMDFGAGSDAAIVDDRQVMGTPVYMAPELFSGAAASPRSDVYALGVLLFRLVTGEYPVAGRTIAEVEAAHATGVRRRLRDLRQDLSAAFVDAVERALATDPKDRPEGAGDLEAALSRAVLPAIASPEPRAAAGMRRRTVIAGLAAAVAALIALPLAVTWSRSVAPDAAPPGAAGIRSIAIRPLTNLTGDPAQAYFAAGLTDVLLAHFGSVSTLRVVALPPSGGGAGGDAAGQLDVDAVFEGSVQRHAGRLRIPARLVRRAGGAVVWGRTYEGAEAEAFNLQIKIAADVTREVGVTLTTGESRTLSRTYALKPEAQEAYLRGRYLLDTQTRPNLQKARADFERAIALEPAFAPAHAAAALTYLLMGNVGDLTPSEVRQLAPAAANTALNLDPTLAEAALAAAAVRFRLDWDWNAAEGLYRRAIELNPSFTLARAHYSRFLSATGRMDDALREAQEGYRNDPLSADIYNVVGLMLYYSRRYEEAIAHLNVRPAQHSARGHVSLGRAYAGARRFPEAIAELRLAYELSGKDASMFAELARTLAASGATVEARRILDELYVRRQSSREYIAPQDLAYVHLALGERDLALGLLGEAIDERASRLLWLGVDPRVDSVRGDPRFGALLARLRPE